MVKAMSRKTLAEQIADLDDPTPKDFDPEEHGEIYQNGDDAESEEDDDDNEVDWSREHYVDVSKSKLRKQDAAALGPQYAGSRISRDALHAEESDDNPFGSGVNQQDDPEDSEHADPENFQLKDQVLDDEAFGEGDEEEFKGFVLRGSGTLPGARADRLIGDMTTNGKDSSSEPDPDSGENEEVETESKEDIEGSSDDGLEDSEHSEEAWEKASDVASSDDEDTLGDAKAADRAELRKMMAEEQKTVAATISQAAKADAEKGQAVKQQRSTFDALLNTRIRLQKALIASNSLSAPNNTIDASEGAEEAVRAAEAAALKLWSTFDSLRQSLIPTSTSTSTNKKRPFSATHSTPTPTLWTQMQTHESFSVPSRRATLTKWSSKIHLPTALPAHSKLTDAPIQQPLTAVLDNHLSATNTERLVKRTRVPRSCAPLQAQSNVLEDAAIYDDADFYTLLLRELVDQRMAESATSTATAAANGSANLASFGAALPNAAAARREARVKKRVDTKASKGRKLRYTVHEKLQNFMAPEDRGTWGERQVDELFGGLLGRRVGLGEAEREGEDGGDGDGEEEGLRLFRSQ
ncbi:MAG: hypothetical protein FRX48_03189 [Lasallia pustulata]|uniref:Protein BFR2 n=1 Tax=Lasallia pustulata TaxID=136370 RepID=A0A5M8PXM7_9LECA|nr:MAG: hypothetical protein FRX48_03189 [Lasallia pustulata]